MRKIDDRGNIIREGVKNIHRGVLTIIPIYREPDHF